MRLFPFFKREQPESANLQGYRDAIDRSQAVIEFTLDGTIISANDNFLQAMGYRLEEIQGKHHRQFVESNYANSAEYREFWRKLGSGSFHSGQFMRLKKNGERIWLQATYNPIFDPEGRPIRIVKFATDITKQVNKDAIVRGQLDAINRSQAVIEFTLDGTIISANDNFLQAMGYHLEEIQGQHHRQFVASEYANSDEYREFWRKLGNGSFLRLKKSGERIWLHATYNPIFDPEGRPIRIVKFATDITKEVTQNEGLKKGVASILDLISEIASTSEDVNYSIQELSATTNDQKTRSEEVAVAVEELVGTIVENAKSTSRASRIATHSGTSAKEGDEIMTETQVKIELIAQVVSSAVTIVERLGESSARIGEIVQVIEQIANQTNLLALNAAIEAARAGTQGRGFAVVAEEVSKLAERTRYATTEIATMIGSIQSETSEAVEAICQGEHEVSEGLALAKRTGKSLRHIVEGASEVSEVITDIAAATEEQSTTSEQIMRSVESISSAAGINATSIDEVADTMIQLHQMTDALRNEVLRLSGQPTQHQGTLQRAA